MATLYPRNASVLSETAGSSPLTIDSSAGEDLWAHAYVIVKKVSGGNTTVIGNTVAQKTSMINGVNSATWTPPSTTFASGDKLRVEIVTYLTLNSDGTGGWYTNTGGAWDYTFSSTKILEPSQWTVYYDVDMGFDDNEWVTWCNYKYNGSSSTSRITGVTLSDEAPPQPPTKPSISVASNAYGSAVITVTDGAVPPTSLTVGRSTSSGGTYTDVTSRCSITNNGNGTWTVVDYRPSYGTPAISLGATGYYKITATNSAGSTLSDAGSASLNVNSNSVLSAHVTRALAVADANFSGGASADAWWPGRTFFVWVQMYRLAVELGLTSEATDWLSYVNAQWDYCKNAARTSSSGMFDPKSGTVPNLTFDQSTRNVWYIYQASRLLQAAGQTTLADEVFSYADDWAYASWTTCFASPIATVNVTFPQSGKTVTANAIKDMSGNTDNQYGGNQELFGMSLFCMLAVDSRSVFYDQHEVGGWLRASLLRTLDSVWGFQWQDGSLPHGWADTYPTYNSNYHFASVLSLVTMKHSLGAGWSSKLDGVLEAANTFSTGSRWTTEPNILEYGGAYVSAGGEEMHHRPVIYWAEGVTDPMPGFNFTMAMHRPNGDLGGYDTSAPYLGSVVSGDILYAPHIVIADGFADLLNTYPTAVTAEATAEATVPSLLFGIHSVLAIAAGDSPAGVSISNTTVHQNTQVNAVVAESDCEALGTTITQLVAIVETETAIGEAMAPTVDWVLTTVDAVTSFATGDANPPLVTQLDDSYVFAVVSDAIGDAAAGIVTRDGVDQMVFATAALATASAIPPMSMVAAWLKPSARELLWRARTKARTITGIKGG